MEVKRLSDTDISELCHTVAKILMDSPEGSYQLKDVTDKWSLSYAFTFSQITYWYNIGEVWVIGENQGMLAGHYNGRVKIFKLLSTTLRANLRMLRSVSKEDRNKISRNVTASAGAQNVKWRKQICKKSNYYFIDLIAIDPALKGSGAFRKLIDPVLVRAKAEGIPVLLDTHDTDNVLIYQHFGFEVVRQYTAKHDQDFIQYAMIKWP